MKKVIPEFKTEEKSRFWDTHSPLDYPNEFTDVKEPFFKTELNFAKDTFCEAGRQLLEEKVS